MKNLLKVSGVALALALAVTGCSKTGTVYEVKNEKVMVPMSVSENDMYKAIHKAAMNKGWTIKRVDDGHAVATITKDMTKAMVDIIYTRNYYSIYYKGSKGLGIDVDKNTIHRDYNHWVEELEDEIEDQVDMLK